LSILLKNLTTFKCPNFSLNVEGQNNLSKYSFFKETVRGGRTDRVMNVPNTGKCAGFYSATSKFSLNPAESSESNTKFFSSKTYIFSYTLGSFLFLPAYMYEV
jgi:hypothetical protein